MGTVIRPARPEDKTKVAELIYLAGASHLRKSLFDVMFDTSREETLKHLEKLFVAKNRSWFQWSHFFVAEVDGKIAAAACGYSELYGGSAQFRDALVETTGWAPVAYEALGERMSPLMKVKPMPPEDVWIVENVAVFPEYRHHGLVQLLFEEIFERGRQKGFTRAQISFIMENVEAQKAYERAGFRLGEEHTDESFEKAFGSRGMKTYVRDL